MTTALNLPVQNFKTPEALFPPCSSASAKRLQNICTDLLNPSGHLKSNTLLHCFAFLVAVFCFIGSYTLELVKWLAVPVPVKMYSPILACYSIC